jgi:hypothetical protein
MSADDHFYDDGSVGRITRQAPTVLRGYYNLHHDELDRVLPPRKGKSMAKEVDPARIQLWVDAMVDVLTHGVKPRFPAEPPIGSVLRWTRTFDRKTMDPKTYEYVALRAETGWHVTGRENAVLPFDVLLDRIGDNPCSLVADYVDIPPREPNPLDEITDPRDWVRAVFTDPKALQNAAEQKSRTVNTE